jgi:hypothetical protein
LHVSFRFVVTVVEPNKTLDSVSHFRTQSQDSLSGRAGCHSLFVQIFQLQKEVILRREERHTKELTFF